jgi:ABC-type nitrate/sulfonate/bicarbonate transport system substrate-binding protein
MQAMDKARGVVVHSGSISHFEGSKGTRAVVDWTRGVLTTTEPAVRRNPRTVDAVVRAFAKAQQFLTDSSNKDEAIKIYSEFQGQDVAFNVRQFPGFEFSLALDEGFLDGMNKPLDFLESIGRVKKRIDPLDYTYAEPLRKVSPQLVTIKARYKP